MAVFLRSDPQVRGMTRPARPKRPQTPAGYPQTGTIQNPGLGLLVPPTHASESRPALEGLPLPAAIQRKTLAWLRTAPLSSGFTDILLQAELGRPLWQKATGLARPVPLPQPPFPSLHSPHSTRQQARPQPTATHHNSMTAPGRSGGNGGGNPRLEGLRRGHDMHAPASMVCWPQDINPRLTRA